MEPIQNFRDRALNVAVLLAVVSAVVSAAVTFRSTTGAGPDVLALADTVEVPEQYFTNGQLIGSVAAPVKMVVFSDYECAACKRFAAQAYTLQKIYPADLAIMWRNLPLQGHPKARVAALSAWCSGKLGRFEEAHIELFNAIDSVVATDTAYFTDVNGVGLRDDMLTCLRSGDAEKALAVDSLAASRLPAIGTPTILLQNLRFMGSPPGVDRLVRRLVAEAKHPPS